MIRAGNVPGTEQDHRRRAGTCSERTSLRRLGIFTNRSLVGAVALTVALEVLLVVTPFLRDLLELEPLDPAHWLLIVSVALAYLVSIELDKWIASRRRPTP